MNRPRYHLVVFGSEKSSAGLITVTVGYDHEEYQTITEDMPGANLVVFKDVEEKERDFNYK